MFKQYRRKQIAQLRSVTQKDIDLYKAQRLVTKEYFNDNFEELI